MKLKGFVHVNKKCKVTYPLSDSSSSGKSLSVTIVISTVLNLVKSLSPGSMCSYDVMFERTNYSKTRGPLRYI